MTARPTTSEAEAGSVNPWRVIHVYTLCHRLHHNFFVFGGHKVRVLANAWFALQLTMDCVLAV